MHRTPPNQLRAAPWIVLTACSVVFSEGILARMALAQEAHSSAVHIEVDANQTTGEYKPIWNYFGADEPNYTYAPNGRKLLKELSAINPSVPVYFRPHNLLTSGNGKGSLKWGSTNAYTAGRNSEPIYDWPITDKIFDNFRDTKITPLVEVGFMPEALSQKPAPYRHEFPAKPDIFTGWSYPPNDNAKWRALIVAWVQHLQHRYGASVEAWRWEVWNEPDIAYFHGTTEEYLKLYDVTTDAIHEVLPHAQVGGPATTGPSEKNTLLQAFLEHCAHGTNAATGKAGSPLDFISFHPKGSPKFVDGHVRMGLAAQLKATDRGFQIVSMFPQYRNTPIVLSETDPEGCAACKGPQNGYRNGALYGVSVTEMLVRSAELARLRGVNLAGAVTWAFEFEDQPWFAGFRELATNGIDKPVLNVFRMFGKLGGVQVAATSSGARNVLDIEKNGVTATSDIDALATRQDRGINLLIWNYNDDDIASDPTAISLRLGSLPAKEVHVLEYRMDRDHSNGYTAWQALGSPQKLGREQLRKLRGASRLQVVTNDTENLSAEGMLQMNTQLARQAVALYQITW